MRRTPRTTAVAALLLAPVLAAPASATSVHPPRPTGHMEVAAPHRVPAGSRPVVRVHVLELADASWPEGRVTVVVHGPGGWEWRTSEPYQGKRLRLRLPKVREPGRYAVRATFRPWRGTPYDPARDTDTIRVVASAR